MSSSNETAPAEMTAFCKEGLSFCQSVNDESLSHTVQCICLLSSFHWCQSILVSQTQKSDTYIYGMFFIFKLLHSLLKLRIFELPADISLFWLRFPLHTDTHTHTRAGVSKLSGFHWIKMLH